LLLSATPFKPIPRELRGVWTSPFGRNRLQPF